MGPVLAAHPVSLCVAANLVRLPRGSVRLGPADHLQHHPRPVALERLHPQQRQRRRLHGRGAGGAAHRKLSHSVHWSLQPIFNPEPETLYPFLGSALTVKY